MSEPASKEVRRRQREAKQLADAKADLAAQAKARKTQPVSPAARRNSALLQEAKAELATKTAGKETQRKSTTQPASAREQRLMQEAKAELAAKSAQHKAQDSPVKNAQQILENARKTVSQGDPGSNQAASRPCRRCGTELEKIGSGLKEAEMQRQAAQGMADLLQQRLSQVICHTPCALPTLDGTVSPPQDVYICKCTLHCYRPDQLLVVGRAGGGRCRD